MAESDNTKVADWAAAKLRRGEVVVVGPKEKSLNFQLCFQSATTMYFSRSISA